MVAEPRVFIVDDVKAVRESIRALVESVGLTAEAYASFPEFLDAYDPDRPGCLVLDVRMPDVSGIDALEKLKAQRTTIPVIIITAYGDVQTAVRAMKAGAVDFLEKPFNNQVLLDRIQRCVVQNSANRLKRLKGEKVLARLALLTPRERQVMDLVVAGKPNRAIAEELGISRRTVEVHRARVMRKMQADTVQTLMRMGVDTYVDN